MNNLNEQVAKKLVDSIEALTLAQMFCFTEHQHPDICQYCAQQIVIQKALINALMSHDTVDTRTITQSTDTVTKALETNCGNIAVTS